MEIKILDQSIQDRGMSVDVQPPTDIRRRYESDGKRQIERSRCQPMAIKVKYILYFLLNQINLFFRSCPI